MINEYKMLQMLDEVKNQPQLKEIKSTILRLDSKISTYQKKQSLLQGSMTRTSEMIDSTYATKAMVEQKIDEMDLIRDEMLLNGSSVMDSIDLESISELLANVESLSNHFERKSLDNIIEKGFVPQDRDKRFEEILRNEGLTVPTSNLSELEERAS
jgi:predicted MarR family transcription regulator